MKLRHRISLAALVASLAGAGCPADTPAGPPDLAPVAKKSPLEKPANTVGGFSFQLPPRTLQPGQEAVFCFISPLELMGPSHIVGGGQLTTGPGMHHGNVTTRQSTGTGVRECPSNDTGSEVLDIFAGGTVLFGSSTQLMGSEWLTFPAGMGFKIKDGFEIVARMHYLNATGHAASVQPRYEWFTIDEARVTQLIAPFAWDYHKFSIPPLSTLTVTGTCNFPAPMKIVSLLPHMHKLGRSFTAGWLGGPSDGKLFLDSPGYSPDNGVLVEFDPVVDLTGADGVQFSCTWDNTFDKTITFGYGDNEMCILFGYGYPPANAYSALAGSDSCVVAAGTN